MSDESMLKRLRSDPAAVDLLAGVFEFDVSRTAPVEPVRLASGAKLDVIAGDGAGGSYFLCGEGGRRPVLYATSEGQAGLIAADLTAAMELIVGAPFWRDCLKFSAGGRLEEMRSAALRCEPELVEDTPDIEERQARLRATLGLGRIPVGALLAALHAAVTATAPDFVLLGPEGDEYESLCNTFRVSDNPAWR
ncbi:hypothetical protein ABZ801_38190 [Actinomadura sp. NPDC047616]|uniref:hypothetical protein n=1 Tax=Actinomadura sp. NPDC047616 TaxID=3155914 RepID=UPI0033F3132B